MTPQVIVPDAYRPEATAHLRDSWDGAHCENQSMSTTNLAPTQINDLKLICVGCPVLKRCGQWGIGVLAGREDADEVIAGMTRSERSQVRKVITTRRTAAKETAA
jgi:hypothetical protein